MKKIKNILFWSESQNDVFFSEEDNAEFNVNLGKLLVGTLLFAEGTWHFSYSNEFKAQNNILPLTNFPSKNKEYSAKELWPFFTSRIPSNAQMQIEKNAAREDLVKLLQKFGRKTVANPFELTPVV